MSFIAPSSARTVYFDLSGKSNPELYPLALQHSGMTADQSVAFEDSPQGSKAVLATRINLVLMVPEHSENRFTNARFYCDNQCLLDLNL